MFIVELDMCGYFLWELVSGKQALSLKSCSKDQSKFCSRSSECRESNRPSVDEVAIVASLKKYAQELLSVNFGLDKLRVLIGLGFLFELRGIFHLQKFDVQLI